MPPQRNNNDKLKQLTKIYSNGAVYQPPSRQRRPLKEKEVTPYPDLVARDHQAQFEKQMSVLVEKNLKKKLSPIANVEQLKASFAKQAHVPGQLPTPQRTLVVSLEECLLKTGLYREELPKVDGEFKYQKLAISICFRKGLREFLHELSKHFEIIAWTSSSKEYSALLSSEVEKQLQPFKFAHVLSQDEQTQSQDKEIYVKGLDVLAEGRDEKEIIILDNHMASFTNKLTNGIFVPSFELHGYDSEEVLASLAKYLASFALPREAKGSRQSKMRSRRSSVPLPAEDQGVPDVRCKIKEDFDLLNKFNSFKQNQAFQRIATRAQEVKECLPASLAFDCESMRRFKSPDVRERFESRIPNTEPQSKKSSWGRSRDGQRMRSQWTTASK